MLSKIVLSCRLDPIGPVAKIELVHVDCEDFILREIMFHSVGKDGLPDLTRPRTTPGQEHGSCHLLGNGTSPLYNLPCLDILEHGPKDTAIVNPFMLIKMCILSSDKGMNKILWDLIEWHQDSTLVEKLCHNLPMPVIDVGDCLGVIILQRSHIGKSHGKIEKDPSSKEGKSKSNAYQGSDRDEQKLFQEDSPFKLLLLPYLEILFNLCPARL